MPSSAARTEPRLPIVVKNVRGRRLKSVVQLPVSLFKFSVYNSHFNVFSIQGIESGQGARSQYSGVRFFRGAKGVYTNVLGHPSVASR